MKFTDIKPNPKDYSRETIIKAFQDRYRYTGQLTKLIQTPVKIPYYPFSKDPYIIQNIISEPKILDALSNTIEKALIDTWSQNMAQFNPVANYINQCVNDGILRAPEHRHTLEALTEDQCYFQHKAQQLKSVLEKRPWKN